MTERDFKVRRVGVVSHDYNLSNCYGHHDFAEHFTEINHVCDNAGCDTILYSLYTWDPQSPMKRDHITMFQGLTTVQLIIIEIGNRDTDGKVVEVWLRDAPEPIILRRCFGKSGDRYDKKARFMEEVPKRIIGNCMVVICGESNIAIHDRKNGTFRDPFNFNNIIKSHGVRVILNPLHDYMSRYQMKLKRGYYSSEGRAVITVWNMGKKKGEARLPWTMFVDGVERTYEIREIPSPIAVRPDIRIGIVSEIG